MRSIAGGSKIDSGAITVGYYSKLLDRFHFQDVYSLKPTDSDIKLSFTRIVMNEAGLKLSNTATPTVFLLLEFFDFEFQITPLIQGPE